MLDTGDGDTPDFYRLAILGNDVGERGVGGFEADPACTLPVGFDGEVVIDDSDDYMTGPGSDRPINDQHVAIPDASVPHGFAAYPELKGCLGVLDEVLQNINTPRGVVICRRWESSGDVEEDSVDGERAGDVGRGEHRNTGILYSIDDKGSVIAGPFRLYCYTALRYGSWLTDTGPNAWRSKIRRIHTFSVSIQ
jgi:hypothetical protein